MGEGPAAGRRAGRAAAVASLLLAGCVSMEDFPDLRGGFQSMLSAVRFAGARYAQDGSRGSECALNQDALEIGLLPLVTTWNRQQALLRPGALLGPCTLALSEQADDADGRCYLGADDVVLSSTRAHLTELSGEPGCCGALCGDPGDPQDTRLPQNPADGCESLGGAWECYADRAFCQRDLTLAPRSLSYAAVGEGAPGRAVALLMDNSGTLKGRGDDCVPNPPEATDRRPDGTEDSRIAAAKDLVWALDDGADFVGLYTFDTAGSSGVQSVTEVELSAAGTQGFVSDLDSVEDVVLKISRHVACGAGSPVWDAVVRAADDLRELATSRRLDPVIVLFTDGAPDSSDAQLSDAIEAVVGDPGKPEDDIPVFLAHLDNTSVMDPPVGRYEAYETLACVSGGAYFHLDDPSKLDQLFMQHLPYATAGRYWLEVGYEELKLGDEFPSDACYAIRTDLKLTVQGTERILTLDVRAAAGKGAQFDTRIHVCKP